VDVRVTKGRIIDKAFELGFHQVGFGQVRRFDELERIFDNRETLEFEPEDINIRLDPEVHFPGGKTFIGLALSYDLAWNSHLGQDEVKVSSALEIDYHIVIRKLLYELLEFTMELMHCKGKTFVDLEGLNDRAVFIECGMGYRGKNSHIISPYQGTHYNIGYLIIDKELDSDPIELGDCGACDLCVKACPVSAIRGDYTVDSEKCLSYLTQKKTLSISEEKMIETCIYGCDICQLVCPENTVFATREHSVFKASDLLELSNRKFRKIHGNRDFSWRGYGIIKRNVQWSVKNRL
jgi:epoxyqueuosine reductase